MDPPPHYSRAWEALWARAGQELSGSWQRHSLPSKWDSPASCRLDVAGSLGSLVPKPLPSPAEPGEQPSPVSAALEGGRAGSLAGRGLRLSFPSRTLFQMKIIWNPGLQMTGEGRV